MFLWSRGSILLLESMEEPLYVFSIRLKDISKGMQEREKIDDGEAGVSS